MRASLSLLLLVGTFAAATAQHAALTPNPLAPRLVDSTGRSVPIGYRNILTVEEVSDRKWKITFLDSDGSLRSAPLTMCDRKPIPNRVVFVEATMYREPYELRDFKARCGINHDDEKPKS